MPPSPTPAEKAAADNKAGQMNPPNEKYYKSRGDDASTAAEKAVEPKMHPGYETVTPPIRDTMDHVILETRESEREREHSANARA